MKTKETPIECEDCTTGVMVLRYSKKHDRSFYGCTNYPQCVGSMSLHKFKRAMDRYIGDYDETELDLWQDWFF